MTKVTSQEIAKFRSLMVDDPQAMETLDLIEDCDGDLEDAVMTLAIKAGQQPEQTNSEWLDALAKKWRAIICEQEHREDLLNGSIQEIIKHLGTIPSFPQGLAAPVLIYILKQGVNSFCEPLDLLKSH
ncbi:hypothetical protein RI030_01620 [Aphanizomenon flos-aquae NRERC-008]|jgi:hypothetical protein|uniref:Uncharacterized protein n=1 Tax=Aphanizomenon flos-aquae FACHB-1249 TaxID=2692889 RepID=A0ABR8IU09_APHFL|nr:MULTISPECIES: hypothetical protein [Aphanizomenon]MBD2391332.1 hypothetical protein [Aphanizomenon flos-aquae FACHB-1171]MBD2557241.1 hypothetical protein [Aphanizomenon flos-aquae FACHB-1290]MBD2632493.1 hypothetical protein [Aphanizomenon sp. FACHB-1399]MBD2643395.1 hypothetical protein [Aphanizomenon sp. FACHB-1401]MBD2656582.1 hypothetical protein [Aphanizomenon flos-aquae FACHB-1265]